MPFMVDIRIRMRLARVWLANHRSLLVGLFVVPVVCAVYLLLFTPTINTEFDSIAFTQAVQAAQIEELNKAQQGIYHVVREIHEGADKPAYVANIMGESTTTLARVDVVETYQHNDTALTLIESNTSARSFEAFLSRTHDDGGISLHHYGPVDGVSQAGRAVYDTAHDLRTLYDSYTSIESPHVPVLADNAVFSAYNADTNTAKFITDISETISITSIVDVTTNQVIEDIIYVTADDEVFEMSRIVYRQRSVVPATQFDTIFATDTYDYTVITS